MSNRVGEDSGLLPVANLPILIPKTFHAPRSGSMNEGFTRRQWPQ
jgi:hypothetical protein